MLSKRMAAATRVIPSATDSTPKDYVEWKAVEEGVRLLERDLAKLQVCVPRAPIFRPSSYLQRDSSRSMVSGSGKS